MNKLDEIIGHLSTQEPQMPDADLFCEDLLTHLPGKAPRRALPYWPTVVRSITSAAAILLLFFCLLPSEQEMPSANEKDYRANLATTRTEWNTLANADATPRQLVQDYVRQKKAYYQSRKRAEALARLSW